jgi:hypothetical protein
LRSTRESDRICRKDRMICRRRRLAARTDKSKGPIQLIKLCVAIMSTGSNDLKTYAGLENPEESRGSDCGTGRGLAYTMY